MNAGAYGSDVVAGRGALYFARGGLGSGRCVECFDDDYHNSKICIDSSRANSSVDIEGNNVYVNNGEVRVSNYTARYWKRIS